MDIHKINRVIDMFLKNMYDVDVYLTPDGKEYKVNILFFPSKFLKGSSEYSEKYYNFFNRGNEEIQDDIFKAFKYLGLDSSKVERDYIHTHMSSDIPEYLKNYQRELLGHINDFFESDLIEDFNLSNIISNVRVREIEPLVTHMHSGVKPYLSLRLVFDTNNYPYDLHSLLNSTYVMNPLIDYLKTKMELDPQISFWFD